MLRLGIAFLAFILAVLVTTLQAQTQQSKSKLEDFPFSDSTVSINAITLRKEGIISINSSRRLQLFRDSTYTLTLDRIKSDSGLQQKNIQHRPDLPEDYSVINDRAAYWTYFRLQNTDTESLYLWLFTGGYPWDSITVYYKKRQDSNWNTSYNGTAVKPKDRAMPDYTWQHGIQLSPLSVTEFYVRYVSRANGQVSLSFPLFVRPNNAVTGQGLVRSNDRAFWAGALLSIFVVMAAYNLAIYIFNKEPAYLWYAITLLLAFINRGAFSGLDIDKFLQDTPLFAYSFHIHRFALSLLYLCCALFLDSYLSLRERHPILRKYFYSISAFVIVINTSYIMGVSFWNSLFAEYAQYWNLMPEVVFALIAMIIPSVAAIKGYRPARILALSMLFPVVGHIASVAIRVLPFGGTSILWDKLFELGISIQVLVISLGLASKMRLMRLELEQQREAEQQRLQREAEEKRLFLEEQKRELERLVAERTAELTDANEEISRQMEVLEAQARDIELANTSLQEKNIEIDNALSEAEAERTKANALLLNVLPAPIAERLKHGEVNIADFHPSTSILFADIVGFTPLSQQIEPHILVGLLNELFSLFDRHAAHWQVERIKTIGDAYMVAAGVPLPLQQHELAMMGFAFDILAEVDRFAEHKKLPFALRIGLHCGPVVGAVVGEHKFTYDIWSDAVNIAARMESHGEKGKIHCTEEFVRAIGGNPDLLQKHGDILRLPACIIEFRGTIEVKGKGLMPTYFLYPPEK